MTGPAFFESRAAFRDWLARHHDSVDELEVGYYKKGTGHPSVTYPESVDEALCFGWIDGVRHARDADSYTVRFTPRRPGSIWSAANVKRAEQLVAEGRMAPAGLAVFESRDPGKTNIYSFEQRVVRFDDDYEAQFRSNATAWDYFQAQPPGYRRVATWWVMSAKQILTRERRLATLIKESASGRRLAAMESRRSAD
jgi:uncharacterized protein YdeI (YjbR/CyaY-like superfamily)